MFQYQESVSKGAPKLCTKEIWDQLIDSPEVKNICNRIAALDPQAEDYNDRKQALKKRLPIIIPHAASFKNNKRVSADAIPSGLAMLDVDHVDNPREWFEAVDKQVLSDNKIYLVAITASGKGLCASSVKGFLRQLARNLIPVPRALRQRSCVWQPRSTSSSTMR